MASLSSLARPARGQVGRVRISPAQATFWFLFSSFGFLSARLHNFPPAHGACGAHVLWGKLLCKGSERQRKRKYSRILRTAEILGRRWRGNLKSAENWAVSASRPSFCCAGVGSLAHRRHSSSEHRWNLEGQRTGRECERRMPRSGQPGTPMPDPRR